MTAPLVISMAIYGHRQIDYSRGTKSTGFTRVNMLERAALPYRSGSFIFVAA